MIARCIAHLDLDAFYVSVELQRRPELRGRPVVVAGSGPRAVVTTASYEARSFGVYSATPASRARRRCPQAIFIEPDFESYRARSADVMRILQQHAPLVEVAGLDEAYLDLSALLDPEAVARSVKSAVELETGLGSSVGIGPNKLIAKIASGAEKPDGFVVLTHAQARERFAATAPGLLPGVGPKTARRLAARGVHSIATLAATADDVLAEWFGPRLGPWLGQLARFEDDSPLVPVHTPKSESRETTFDYDIHMRAELESILDRLAEELCASLAMDDRRGRTISIKIRLDNFSTHTRSRTIDDPTNELAVVREISRELLRAFDPARPVRLLGIRVASFVSPSTGAVAQLPLPAPTAEDLCRSAPSAEDLLEPTRATRPAEAPTARCGSSPDP